MLACASGRAPGPPREAWTGSRGRWEKAEDATLSTPGKQRGAQTRPQVPGRRKGAARSENFQEENGQARTRGVATWGGKLGLLLPDSGAAEAQPLPGFCTEGSDNLLQSCSSSASSNTPREAMGPARFPSSLRGSSIGTYLWS